MSRKPKAPVVPLPIEPEPVTPPAKDWFWKGDASPDPDIVDIIALPPSRLPKSETQWTCIELGIDPKRDGIAEDAAIFASAIALMVSEGWEFVSTIVTVIPKNRIGGQTVQSRVLGLFKKTIISV